MNLQSGDNNPMCQTCVKKQVENELNEAEKAVKEGKTTYNGSTDNTASSSKDGDVEMTDTSPANKERDKAILQSQEIVDKIKAKINSEDKHVIEVKSSEYHYKMTHDRPK